MSEPTHFTEANALLYCQQGDHDEAERALSGLTETELRELSRAADELQIVINRVTLSRTRVVQRRIYG